MAYIIMAYIGVADIVVAYIGMAYIVATYALMALSSYGTYSYGMYSCGKYGYGLSGNDGDELFVERREKTAQLVNDDDDSRDLAVFFVNILEHADGRAEGT